jgi:predicted phage tail protein
VGVTATYGIHILSTCDFHTQGGEAIFIEAGNIKTDTTTGMKIATASNQLLGFFGATPVVRQTGNHSTGTFSQQTGTAVLAGSRFTGTVGTTSYTVGDIVDALKQLGLITS